MEIWKAIEGYEGFYEISNLGRVKSLKRTETRKNGNTLNISIKSDKMRVKEGFVCCISSLALAVGKHKCTISKLAPNVAGATIMPAT